VKGGNYLADTTFWVLTVVQLNAHVSRDLRPCRRVSRSLRSVHTSGTTYPTA